MKIQRPLLILMLLFGLSLLTGCAGGSSSNPVVTPAVAIQNNGAYYKVIMDYSGRSSREMGTALAQEIQRSVPDYEAVMDGMLKSQLDLLKAITGKDYFPIALTRAEAIVKNIPQEYRDELEAMQEIFNYRVDSPGDGRLSANELLVIQLFPDVLRPSQCSASAAFGNSSSTGRTVLGRNLDWFSLPLQAGSKLHAVTVKVKDGVNLLCNVNILGGLFAGSLFTKHKVFAAVLDAETNQEYPDDDIANKRSYVFDLRYAMENLSTLQDVADFMKAGNYAFNHLIFLAGENTVGVLENNIESPGRGLRTSSSVLRPEPEYSWGIPQTIATVNDFRLPDNFFNPADISNKKRWESFKNRYTKTLSSGQIDVEKMKGIAGYDGPLGDGDDEHGALFLSSTQPEHYTTMQSIILRMDTLEMWVHFAPVSGTFPRTPTYVRVVHGLE